MVTFISYGLQILIFTSLLGCAKVSRQGDLTPLPFPSSTKQSEEVLLQAEENRWNSWISSKGSQHRKNLSELTLSPTPTSERERNEAATPHLFYEHGYSFPSLRARVFGELVTIPLQPHLKRLDATGISRIAFSPEEKKVAIIFSKKSGSADSLLVLDLTRNSPEVLIVNAYDFVWGDTDSLLFYTLKPKGIPSELYALYQGRSQQIVTTHSPGESILIQRSLHHALRIVRTSSPLKTTVGALSFANLSRGELTIAWFDGTALSLNENGTYIISYHANPFGNLLLYSPHTPYPKKIATGTRQKALLDLAELPEGVILYTGDGHTRSLAIIKPSGALHTLSPPPPLLQLSASHSNDRITIYGESVICPREKLTEVQVNSDYDKNEISLNSPSCTNVATTLHSTKSKDGSDIPLTRNKLHGPEKGLVLYVYAAYGVSLSLQYSERMRFLAEEGFDIVLCHARGGGEFGPAWHEQSRLSGKTLTIEDTESCLTTIRKLLPRPLPVIGVGHSAGGWLLNQVARKLPNQFSALLLDAPMISLPHIWSKQNKGAEDLDMREDLEWGEGTTSETMAEIANPTSLHVFTIIRGLDDLVSPRSIAEWMNSVRNSALSGYEIISYVAKSAGHSSKLSPNDEVNIRSSWRELLRTVNVYTPLAP